MVCSAGVKLVLLQGAQAHAAGVLFPSDDDTLHRTILIANINPLVNTEQVESNCSPYSVVKLLHLIYAKEVNIKGANHRSSSCLASVGK